MAGAFIYGLESDWNWLGVKTSQSGSPNDDERFSTSFNIDWLATIRGRTGIAFDSTLFYVTGGLAFGHVKNGVDLSDVTVGTGTSFAQNQTKVGWTAGVGVEHMLSQHWTARAEFRYVDLGTATIACDSNFDGCSTFGYRGTFSNTLKLGLVGLNYKF